MMEWRPQLLSPPRPASPAPSLPWLTRRPTCSTSNRTVWASAGATTVPTTRDPSSSPTTEHGGEPHPPPSLTDKHGAVAWMKMRESGDGEAGGVSILLQPVAPVSQSVSQSVSQWYSFSGDGQTREDRCSVALSTPPECCQKPRCATSFYRGCTQTEPVTERPVWDNLTLS